MTHEQEKTLREMYHDARWGQLGLRLCAVNVRDFLANDKQWDAITDFYHVHGIELEDYWPMVLPVEERICMQVKEMVEQERQQPGRKCPRCVPRDLAGIMGYGPLPFYPANIGLMVALERLCRRERRAHERA